ncbi:MAG: glycosyltransferase family 4 protein [Candidatus Rokubacteria bacterium]|nr:glycosyltransferase family 4 protein [Candidatus Rokubacteria bacterium]
MPRIALLAPFAPPSVRGNAVTVARIAAGLAAAGIDARIWDCSVTDHAVLEAEVHAFAPAVVHAFHAWQVGPPALRIARRAELPLVVTLTGTDANHDLFDPERAAATRRVLEGASVITVFDASIAARVAAALPDLRARLAVVPQASALADGARFDLDAAWPGLPPGRVLFVFPAGIRPVKRPRLPLEAFDALVARHPATRLLYAGPAIEAAETRALAAALVSRPWARYAGAVPHDRMASLLGQADVVLNCSESEGGMPNAILEALACGRAVVAADIEGNRSLIEHDVTGLLFRDAPELGIAAERLVVDAALRTRLGAAGQARVSARFPPSREIDGYVTVYEGLADRLHVRSRCRGAD